jgi:hypothetical protein
LCSDFCADKGPKELGADKGFCADKKFYADKGFCADKGPVLIRGLRDLRGDFCADKGPKELGACMEVCKVALRDCREASCNCEQTITAVAEYTCGDVSA